MGWLVLGVVGIVILAAAVVSIAFYAGFSSAVHSQEAEIGIIEEDK